MTDTPSIPPALTAEERRECEIEGRYGISDSYIHIDYKGRIFAGSFNRDTEEDMGGMVFNEASVGPESVRRLRALCDHWLVQHEAFMASLSA